MGIAEFGRAYYSTRPDVLSSEPGKLHCRAAVAQQSSRLSNRVRLRPR
jgi:hypothetical protein